MTDAAGHVVFDGIDWSLGLADVTSYVEGHNLVSIVGIGRRSELSLQHVNFDAVSHSEVTLSGTLRNRAIGWLTAITELRSVETVTPAGDTYTLRVRAGVPLTLVVLQANRTWVAGGEDTELRWTVVRHDALLDDTMLDLDLSRQEEPERVSGSIGIPAGFEDLSWTIAATPGYGFVGRASRVRASAGQIDFDIDFLRLVRDEDVSFAFTGYYPFGTGPFTFARRPGYPRAGVRT